jgi:hypothetical protein
VRPEAWKGSRKGAHLSLLRRIEHVTAGGPPGLIVLLRLLSVCERVVPVGLEGLRHVPMGRRHGQQATLGHIGCILRPRHLTGQPLCGCWSPFADCVLPRERRRHGPWRHLRAHDGAAPVSAFTAWAVGAAGGPRSECGPVAWRERIDAPTRPALVRRGQVASACSTPTKALQPGGPQPCWPWRVPGHLALPAFLVGRACLPAAVARLGLWPQGMPGLAWALLLGRPTPGPLDETRAALGQGAGRARMLPETEGPPTRECRPPPCPAVRARARPGGDREPVPSAVLPPPARGADVPEGVAQQPDRCLPVRRRIAGHRAGWRRDASARQLRGACPPGGLLAYAPRATRPPRKARGCGHGPLQPEPQPRVALAQSIHRLGSAEQGLVKPTHLQPRLDGGLGAGQA